MKKPLSELWTSLPKKARKILLAAASVLVWLLLWQGAAILKNQPLLFPAPTAIIKALCRLLGQKAFYRAIFLSLWNVLSGILSAMLLGVLLAFLCHRFALLRSLILPPMTVIKSTPVASVIILLWIWLSASRVPSAVTFLIVLPVVWANLDTGLQKIDPQLLQVTAVYRIPPIKKLRILTVPSLLPYFVSACRSALGLAWKAGIAAEIIVMPRVGIGTMIGTAKLYLNTEEMFAWTLTVVLLSLAIEYGFVSLMNRIPAAPGKQED